MTTFTPTIVWCTSCVELAHSAHCFTPDDDTAHLMAQVLSNHIVIHGHTHGAFSLTRSLPSSFNFPSCPSPSTSSTPSCSLSSTTRSSWQVLRYFAAEESEDTLNSFTSHTGYEPNGHDFNELNDTSVPFSFKIPAADQDVDDVTLGEMLTAAHRGQVEYCVPGGMSVSQSSSSVMFDGSGQPDERNSSNAQIRTLLEEQRQMIIAEYCEKIGQHELHAAHAAPTPTRRIMATANGIS